MKLDGWPRLAVRLLAATGARVGEVAGLRWQDVDWQARAVRLDGKTGERWVPLGDSVVVELRAWAGEAPVAAEYVLGVVPKTSINALQVIHLPKACEAAEVPRFTPHGLRRSAVDALLRAGVEVAAAAAFSGHSPEVMLRAYRRVTMEDKRKALAQAALSDLPRGEVYDLEKRRG